MVYTLRRNSGCISEDDSWFLKMDERKYVLWAMGHFGLSLKHDNLFSNLMLEGSAILA